MKNFDLLPLDEISLQRVKKFAEMHQRFGKIIINVIAFDKEQNIALVQIRDNYRQLKPVELVEKVHEVFKGEVPESWILYYTLMEEDDSKFYKTWDNKYVIRPKNGKLLVWEIFHRSGTKVFRVLKRDKTTVDILDSEDVKAEKWLKNYLITHNEWL